MVPIMPTRTVPVTSARSALDVGGKCLELRQHPVGAGQGELPLFCQVPGPPVHERGRELLLQPRHVGRHVGLDGPEVIRGRRERALFGDGHQDLQLAEFHHIL